MKKLIGLSFGVMIFFATGVLAQAASRQLPVGCEQLIWNVAEAMGCAPEEYAEVRDVRVRASDGKALIITGQFFPTETCAFSFRVVTDSKDARDCRLLAIDANYR
jgi:hypothetical protein